MTCAESRAPNALNPLGCCWPVPQRWRELGEACKEPLAGVFLVYWAGEAWSIPLCQHHADEQAAGAPVLELYDIAMLARARQCWDEHRAIGLNVILCPTCGLHRATLAKLEQMARPQIFPQDEED